MTTSALLKQNVNRHYPVVTHGEGVFLFDTDGRRYLDGSGGAMTASIGHGLREIAEATAAQMSRVAFSYRTQFTNEPAEELARRLTDLAPGDLTQAFFVNSGSEATEFAMRAAIGYWREHGQPTKVKVLSRQVSYHGMTLGALSMSGHANRRPDYGTLLHPLPVAPPVHARRYAHAGETDLAYAQRAAFEFETAILEQDPNTVAAIIVEPIVGAAGGVLMPPPCYLRHLRHICDRLDVLLILDEVITGMGRTGSWFASTDEDVVPDLLALGKGLSAGYAPMAGVLLRTRIGEAFATGSGIAPFGHTFSGNPASAATCLAVLDYMERRNVLANARERGKQFEEGLRALSSEFPYLADVRGRGLLWGFDLVADPETLQPPDPRHETAGVFVEECFQQGLIAYPGGIEPHNNAAILAPPLTINPEETQLLLELLGAAVEAIGRRGTLLA
jgi:adenosylmethionine-8-amino-7-oxononanoate aminotransferase